MKNALLIVILLYICTATYAQSTGTYRYTARQCLNLKGEVKTMITSTGDTLRFDRQGELTDAEGDRLLDFSDKFNDPFKVYFPDEYTRHESNMNESVVGNKENWYVFDHKGRIIKALKKFFTGSLLKIYVYPEYFTPKNFPWRIITEEGDEDFTTFYIVDYYYDEDSFDEQGNWTRRSARGWKLHANTVLWEGYKPNLEPDMKEYKETAQYTYY